MNYTNEQLIDDYLNEKLDEQSFKELEYRLIHDKNFALKYAEMTRFETHLKELSLDSKDHKEWIHELKKQEPSLKKKALYFKIAAQIFVVIGLLTWLVMSQREEANVVMTKFVGVHFDETKADLGPVEYQKVYQLKEGLLALEFNHKTEVIIEAPAKFRSDHENHLWVDFGKVSVEVPNNVKGFEIETKNGVIREKGTSYSINVTKHDTELHVFGGEVNLRKSYNSEPLVVQQGQAANIENSEYQPFRNAWFVHSKEFHQLSEGWSDERRKAWKISSNKWEKNPHLLASYKIEKNQAQFNHSKVIHEANWAQGRWPGTWALDFTGENDHVKIEAKGETDQFTLMAWVRLDKQPRLYNSIYHTHDWERDGQVHWMVIDGQHMLLGIHGNSLVEKESGYKSRWNHSQSNLISNPFGRWVHLVTTYDKQKKSTRFFVDGNFVNESKFEIAHTAIFDAGQIGNWNSKEIGGSRQLSGRLDEFMIYTTVLSDQKIRDHFNMGNPYNIQVN